MENLYELQAEICKTLSNPKRLEILNFLRNKEAGASDIIASVKISKANLSQHMGVLLQNGVVASRKEGVNVLYRITDDRIIEACSLMRSVLIKILEGKSKMIKGLKSAG